MNLALILNQYLSIVFTGSKRLKTGKSARHEAGDQTDSNRKDDDKVENSIKNLVELKSLR